MRSMLVTGCNRGIGLGLVKHLVRETNPPKHLIATCRSIAKAQELQQLANENKNLQLLELDIRNYDEFDSFTKKVSGIVGQDGLNVVINNAGISSKFTRIQFVKPDQMLEAFKVNTIAPVMLTKALLPHLKKASANNSEKALGSERAVLLNITSILGSIALNTDGGFYPYRCSKAALNMATKSLSVDLSKEGILVFAIHPGWLKTDMGGSNAPLDVDIGVSGIINMLKHANEKLQGAVFEYDGKPLPW